MGSNRGVKRSLGAGILGATFVCLATALAFGQTTTWKGGSGNWSDSTKWTSGVPNASTSASIDAGNSVVSAVILNISGAQVLNLTIDSDDSLGFANNTSLTVNGTSITNNGAISLNSGGNLTELIVGGSKVTLSGTGTLTMGNNSANLITGSAGTNTLTNQETIQGAGNIGNNQMTLVNSGTINANAGAGQNVLYIQTSGGTTNTGDARGNKRLHPSSVREYLHEYWRDH